jgi:Protein of unknown function (DUF2510)
MIAAVSGIVLFISLFLEWYNVSVKSAFVSASRGGSGWEALSFIDILLFVISLIVVGIAVAKAANVMPRLPASTSFITLVLGGLATLLVLFRIISVPDVGSFPGVDVSVGRSFGIFVAFLASAGITVGGWMRWNEEGRPMPGSAGTGAAPGGAPLGAGQAPYGAGQPQATPAPQQQTYAQPAGGGAAPAAQQPAASATPATPAQSDAPAAAKADWYPDPRGEKRLRYWDGSQWTDHTAD